MSMGMAHRIAQVVGSALQSVGSDGHLVICGAQTVARSLVQMVIGPLQRVGSCGQLVIWIGQIVDEPVGHFVRMLGHFVGSFAGQTVGLDGQTVV